MVIDGRFELLEQLGSGGMGTVWRARDVALHREVALKEVRDGGSPQMRERVLREARALARLHHPNVVTIHHIVDIPGGHPWLVMELVAGQSLAQRLAYGPMPPAEAARVGRGILAALRTAQAAGILHRDVKPANVLLRPDGTPVLTDFGIASLGDAPGLTGTGELVGSPEYMAPERLRGLEGHAASDLWSLGLLLYVAVEGRNPFRRDTTMATLAAVLAANIPPATNAGPLEPVLRALLTPDPDARPPFEWLERELARVTGESPAPWATSASGPHPSYGGAPPAPSGQPAFGPGGPPAFGGTGTSPGFGGGKTFASGDPGRHGSPYNQATQTGSKSKAPVVAVLAVAVAATLVVGGVVLVPRLIGETPGTTSTPRAGSSPVTSRDAKPDDDPTPEPSAERETPRQPADLITPEGIRAITAAVKQETGGTKVWELTIYPEYASVNIPVRGRPKAYDSLNYRDGAVTPGVLDGPWPYGGQTFDVTKIDWSVLPVLLKKADQTLKVKKPTSRYVIVKPTWPTFSTASRPTIMVYLSDKYGGGYLAADANGKVHTTHPADS
ncbi:serine/threonine-protein kinase [Nonomuraea sp. NPDC050310]|uniref:serine/threonine-protein kinase n=1 Tax=Nonomuraea sp. NPDC050310 TaxID=3154935 RepID=UPI0033E0F2D9